LDVTQYAGLKTLEAFDPNKAKLYSNLIKTQADEDIDTPEVTTVVY
jgi:hypothetical protein